MAENFAAQAICEAGFESCAAAMYAFMRHFGTALGVGIGGTTFQNVMGLKLGWLGISKSIAKNAEGYLPTLLAMPASQEKDDIIAGYVYGFKGVYRVYLGISCVSLLVSLFIRHYDMNKELRSEHTLEENKLSALVEVRLARLSRQMGPLSVVVDGGHEGTTTTETTLHSDSSSRTEVEVELPRPVVLEEAGK